MRTLLGIRHQQTGEINNEALDVSIFLCLLNRDWTLKLFEFTSEHPSATRTKFRRIGESKQHHDDRPFVRRFFTFPPFFHLSSASTMRSRSNQRTTYHRCVIASWACKSCNRFPQISLFYSDRKRNSSNSYINYYNYINFINNSEHHAQVSIDLFIKEGVVGRHGYAKQESGWPWHSTASGLCRRPDVAQQPCQSQPVRSRKGDNQSLFLSNLWFSHVDQQHQQQKPWLVVVDEEARPFEFRINLQGSPTSICQAQLSWSCQRWSRNIIGGTSEWNDQCERWSQDTLSFEVAYHAGRGRVRRTCQYRFVATSWPGLCGAWHATLRSWNHASILSATQVLVVSTPVEPLRLYASYQKGSRPWRVSATSFDTYGLFVSGCDWHPSCSFLLFIYQLLSWVISPHQSVSLRFHSEDSCQGNPYSHHVITRDGTRFLHDAFGWSCLHVGDNRHSGYDDNDDNDATITTTTTTRNSVTSNVSQRDRSNSGRCDSYPNQTSFW